MITYVKGNAITLAEKGNYVASRRTLSTHSVMQEVRCD